MKINQLIEFIKQKLQFIILSAYFILALLVILDAIPAIVNKEHAHTQIEHIPGFWASFGFIACITIIFLSKWYGHAGIMKPEDYYDE